MHARGVRAEQTLEPLLVHRGSLVPVLRLAPLRGDGARRCAPSSAALVILPVGAGHVPRTAEESDDERATRVGLDPPRSGTARRPSL
ncbi:hypothetical protein GCM10009790_05330 [Georgenia ruanii]